MNEKYFETANEEFLKMGLMLGLEIYVQPYKGYETRIRYSEEDKVFFGIIDNISDLITFECNTLNEFEHEFHKAVDDYFIFCEEIGKKPDVPNVG